MKTIIILISNTTGSLEFLFNRLIFFIRFFFYRDQNNTAHS